MEEKYTRILAKLYDYTYLQTTARIQMDKPGREFKLQRGVRQGGIISPKLFTCLLEDIFRNIQGDYGLNINGTKISNLRFADDIVLMANSADEFQAFITEVNELSTIIALLRQ